MTVYLLLIRNFWNGIVATGVEGMTATDAHGGKIATAQCAETIDRVEGVLRASGDKAATRRKEGGDKSAINADRSDQAIFHDIISVVRFLAT
jgi:hypothetical protein